MGTSVLIETSDVVAQNRIGKVDYVRLWAFDRAPAASQWEDMYLHDPVLQNQGVRTPEDAAAHIRFIDGTQLRVGASSEVVIDEFIYAPAFSRKAFAIDVGKGIMRVVTGKMPKPGFRIETPTAYIGVRGTDFIVQVLLDGTTIVLVITGQISVTPKSAGSVPVDVAAGQTASVGPGTDGVSIGVAPPEDDEGLADGADLRREVDDLGQEAEHDDNDDSSSSSSST